MITGEPGETFVQPIPCGCAGRLHIPGENSLILAVRNYGRVTVNLVMIELSAEDLTIEVSSNKLLVLWVS